MTILIIIAAVCFACIVYSVIGTRLLTTTTYNYVSGNIPNELIDKKAALISDLHCCRFGKKNEKLIEKLKEAKPDYIFITGDIINGNKRKEIEFTQEFLSELSKLKIPMFYSFGNHERKLAFSDGIAYIDNLIIIKSYSTLLMNSTIRLSENSEVLVTGLDIPLKFYRKKRKGYKLLKTIREAADTPYEMKDVLTSFHFSEDVADNLTEDNLEETAKKINSRSAAFKGNGSKEGFRILLAHDPYFFDRYCDIDTRLVLSGHVHGGIARLPLIGGIISPRYDFFPKYSKGMYKKDDCAMIVSAGLGWHNIPIRFNNNPELVIINFDRR